ncbi:MAG: hypothetical protein IKP91_08570 [Bacteroidaceae bacterium]|nr:hypothetical protein [Bacteroidaceae bacterium]
MINDKENFDFNDVPSGWAVCTGTDCPKAAACLRHLTYRHVPHEQTTAMCVMPWAQAEGHCPFYAPIEKVMLARGLNGLFRRLRSRDARHDLRIGLTKHLGSTGSFYRYKNGERWMSPALQEWILQQLQTYGVELEKPFDEYKESYLFMPTLDMP